MKLLSIAIPSYNAAAYLHYCVESLVIGGEQVEVLIINDGSQDQTQEVAERLASKYHGIVRAIYQENKGHGGAVNRGLAEASGRYFKVVDSDDWVDRSCVFKILDNYNASKKLGKKLMCSLQTSSMKKKARKRRKSCAILQRFLKTSVYLDDAKPLRRGKYMMMHSLIYNMNLLRNQDFSCQSIRSM